MPTSIVIKMQKSACEYLKYPWLQFGKNGVLRYNDHFCGFVWRFLWVQMAELSPIDFTIGLPIILEVNEGQNKFEVNISKQSGQILWF